jgi:hypothetical protein
MPPIAAPAVPAVKSLLRLSPPMVNVKPFGLTHAGSVVLPAAPSEPIASSF